MLDGLLMKKKVTQSFNNNILQIKDNLNFKHNKQQNFKTSRKDKNWNLNINVNLVLILNVSRVYWKILQCHLKTNAQANITIAFYCSCPSKNRKQFWETIKRIQSYSVFLTSVKLNYQIFTLKIHYISIKKWIQSRLVLLRKQILKDMRRILLYQILVSTPNKETYSINI